MPLYLFIKIKKPLNPLGKEKEGNLKPRGK
jgi:hypothetical protein